MIFTLKSSKYIYSINAMGDVYSDSAPSILITFKDHFNSREDLNNCLKHLLPTMQVGSELYIQPRSNSVFSNRYRAKLNGSYFRTLIDQLYKENELTIQERADIERDLTIFEQAIEHRSLISKQINKTQADTLLFLLDPYIEDFLLIEDTYLALALLATSVSPCMCDTIKCTDGLIHTVDRNLFERLIKVIPDVEQREKIYSSMEVIVKLFNGSKEMVSTFIRLGSNIPDKQVQGSVIIQQLYRAFNQKFNVTDIPEIKIISYLALSVESRGIFKIDFNEPQQALAKFVNLLVEQKKHKGSTWFTYAKSSLIEDVKIALLNTKVDVTALDWIDKDYLAQSPLTVLRLNNTCS